MIRKITLFFLACLSVFAVQAQQPICGSDGYRQQMIASDPNYAAMQNAAKAAWASYASSMGPVGMKVKIAGGDSVYEVPVVVHVIHDGGAVGSNYNPNDDTINAMINYLNKSFEATWAGYPAVGSGGTKVPIKFVLAKRSPTCGTTSGIVRINGSTNTTLSTAYTNNGVNRTATGGVSDATLKAVSYWPSTEYYNIWLVNKIDGKDGIPPFSGSIVAGYALLPPISNPAVDGMVMLSYLFRPSSYGASTLPHEVGHSFGLLHTFEGSSSSSSCPPNTSCTTQGDEVCDTDPEPATGAGVCPSATSTNPCTSSPYGTYGVQLNFMTYSNCTARKFTPGQRTRMMFYLRRYRGSFLTSLGATAPYTIQTASCTPPNSHTFSTNAGPGRIIITHGPTPSASNPQDTLMHVLSQGYSGDGNAGYIDNTCKHRVELIAGYTYNFRVFRGNGSSFGNDRFKAYIDYNNDGDFNDANETLIGGRPTSGGNASFDTTWAVPLTGITNCVPLRMRIVGEPNSTAYTAFDACTTVSGQAEDYEVLIKGAGTSSGLTGVVSLSKPPGGGNPSCFNTQLTFKATPSSTITPLGYRWYRKNSAGAIIPGPSGGTDTTWTSTSFQNLDTVYVKVAYSGPCGTDTTISDSVVVYRVTSVTPQVTISQILGTNPGCPDDSVVFAVSSTVNPGGSPTYSWYINGVLQTGMTNDTVGIRGFGNGSSIYVIMQSSAGAPCAPPPGRATSNTITYTHGYQTPVVQVALTSGTNPGCSGQTLSFTAITTYGGTNPTYQWRVNGVNAGTNSPNFSGIFNDGDVIDYVFTSNSTCVLPANRTKTSESIEVDHTLMTANITAAVVSGTVVACQGHPVLFAANTSNAGANPGFEWMVNGVPVANSNSPIFQTSTLSNQDKVSVILHATDPCVANPDDTSAEITMTILPSAVPSVTIAITGGKNPWCLDSVVQFTATPFNAGTNPNFEWLVNGFQSFTGPVFSNGAYLNGDVVVCRLNPTDGQCYLPDTVYSSPVTMIRSTLPDPPIIHLVGNMLITNKAGTYRWWGPAGLYTTGTNGSFHPTEKGLYMAVTDNNGCWSLPSNYLLITLLEVNTVELPAVNIYPNPTNGELILDWGALNVNMNIGVYNTLGQQMVNDEVKNASRKVLNLSTLTSGIYYVVMKDGQGNSGTVKITVTR